MTDAGLLIIDKPADITSHGVVSRVRRALGLRKVGHAGTLDPMATGVLVLGVGRATRLLGHLMLHDKDYAATIRLGASTVTDDREGEVLATASAEAVAAIGDEDIRAGVAALTGVIEQVPTSVSAIKVDGERAHRLVRAGADVALTARTVDVARFEISSIRRREGSIDLDVDVTCSTGTYVRALARDLGAGLEIGGHLTALRRTRVGTWTERDAVSLTELEEATDPWALVVGIDDAARRSFPVRTVDADDAEHVRHGRPISWVTTDDGVVALFDETSRLLALAEARRDHAHYLAVFVP